MLPLLLCSGNSKSFGSWELGTLNENQNIHCWSPGHSYPQMQDLWIQKAECSMPFDKRDLSTCGFKYGGSWNQSPHCHGYRGMTIFIIGHSITGAFLWKASFNMRTWSVSLCSQESGILGAWEVRGWAPWSENILTKQWEERGWHMSVFFL